MIRALLLPPLALAMLLAGAGASAQCVGDCHEDGEVTIDELMTVVNIALGSAPLAGCPTGDSNGDGVITVDEIIAAVNRALAGCAPDVAGLWQQDQGMITSSTCAAAVTAIIQQNIVAGDLNCTYEIEQAGEDLTITGMCGGETEVLEGTVDASGRITVITTEQDAEDGCTFAITNTASGIATISPTIGTHMQRFDFAPSCGYADCTIVAQTRWVKLSSLP